MAHRGCVQGLADGAHERENTGGDIEKQGNFIQTGVFKASSDKRFYASARFLRRISCKL